MEINANAPATARRETVIHAPIETVWHVLTDFDNWPTWNKDVSKIKLEGPVAPGTVFRWKAGGLTIVSTIQELTPPRRVSWTGQTFGTQAKHTWDLIAEGDGVRVRTAESFDGWLPSLLRGYMQKTLDKALVSGLDYLKVAAEASKGA